MSATDLSRSKRRGQGRIVFAVALLLILASSLRTQIKATAIRKPYAWFEDMERPQLQPMQLLCSNATDFPPNHISASGSLMSLLQTETETETDNSFAQRTPSDIRIDSRFPRIKIAILRVVGNPLPPRHDSEQAYNNLKFTLEHERDFSDLTKVWVLNRLHNETLLDTLKDLLISYRQKYIVIHFNLTEYSTLKYRFDYFILADDVVHTRRSVHQREYFAHFPLDEAIMHDKNLYVTNQNAARNLMIEVGQRLSKRIDWVLPWDGNCFLHHNAYEELYRDLQAVPRSHKYAITYMNRALTNEELLQDVYQTNATEEPQIIFHRTAQGRFHHLLRYGRMNKVEFLRRLKVRGPWDKWSKFEGWENIKLGPFHVPIPDLHNFTTDGPVRSVGFVTRLCSGKPHLETNAKDRSSARIKSMTLLLGHLDVRVVTELYAFQPGQLVFYHEDALERDRRLYRDGNALVTDVVADLLRRAVQAMTYGPWSVTDKPNDAVPKSGDKHDYFDLAPDYWPPVSKVTERRVNRTWHHMDGERYPPDQLHAPRSERDDWTRMQDMQHNTTILVLAYFMSGEKMFADIAARNIRCWFLNPKTRMNPNMKYSHVAHGFNNETGSPSGILGMKNVYFMLDAVRILEKNGFLTQVEQGDLKAWFTEYLEWLEASTNGMIAHSRLNYHGTYFDIQAIAIASYLNDTAKMIWYSERSTWRLRKQVFSDGKMPHEIEDSLCKQRQRFNLQGWSIFSRMSETVHLPRWTVKTNVTQMPLLCQATKFALPLKGQSERCASSMDIEEDVIRWWPLFQDANRFCPTLRLNELRWHNDFRKPPLRSYSMPSVFHPDDAVAPFWNLGLEHDSVKSLSQITLNSA